MFSVVLAAFQLGFVYALLPGPILIASSQHAIRGGWRQGCWFILGVTLADLIYMAVIHWGLFRLLADNDVIRIGLWLLGGVWLIKLGIDALRESPADPLVSLPTPHFPHVQQTLTDGVLINLLNPLTLVGWVALATHVLVLSQPNPSDHLPTLFMILSGILTWQLLVVGLVSIVRQQIHQRLLKWLSRIGGICLLIYGVSAWVSAIHSIVLP